MRHRATQLSIIAEKIFESEIIGLLIEEGAKGYTIYEGGGNSSFHLHPSSHTAMIDALHLIKIEVIILDATAADRMAERLMEEFFVDQPGIVSLHEVMILRPQKF